MRTVHLQVEPAPEARRELIVALEVDKEVAAPGAAAGFTVSLKHEDQRPPEYLRS